MVWLRAAAATGANAVVNAYAIHHANELTSFQYVVALRVRLGLPLNFGVGLSLHKRCTNRCKAFRPKAALGETDLLYWLDGHHSLGCGMHGYRLLRHNIFLDALIEAYNAAGAHARRLAVNSSLVRGTRRRHRRAPGMDAHQGDRHSRDAPAQQVQRCGQRALRQVLVRSGRRPQARQARGRAARGGVRVHRGGRHDAGRPGRRDVAAAQR
eukprot:1325203-Prymnesium_polylepis.2